MGISTVIADTGRRTKRAVLALAASAAMLVAGIAAAQASCQILADSWIQPPMLAPAMTATPASLARTTCGPAWPPCASRQPRGSRSPWPRRQRAPRVR